MGQDPDVIRRDIEETRERMGDTVDALGHKADVKGRAKESVTGKVNADRRRGSIPTGATPAIRATVSAHAPAAFTTTGAEYVASPAYTRHCAPSRSMRVTSASQCKTPPRPRIPRK